VEQGGEISEAIALELKDQIKRNKVVKVRVLSSSALGASEVAEQLAQSTDSVLVDVRGSNAVFCERREYRNLSQKKNL